MGGNKQSMFVGDTYETSSCGVCTVIEYNGANKVTVQFPDGFCIVTSAGHIREGAVRNPYTKSVYNVGYIGEGPYRVTKGSRDSAVYRIWGAMLQRCYDTEYQAKCNPTYIGCSVSEDWHCYQNYAKDYYELTKGNLCWHVDKDVMFRGNKVYSKENCCALPPELNMLLCGGNAIRGKYPKGVSWNKRQNKFRAYYWCGVGKQVHIGYYDNVASAFEAYKEKKEAFIKQQANKWQSQIDPRAYEALMNYQVEITD